MTEEEQEQENDDKDISISKKDMQHLDKFFADYAKDGDNKDEKEEKEGQEDKETEKQTSDLEKERDSLLKELTDLKETIRQQLIGKLPKKIQGKFKDRSYEELGLLVEYLDDGLKSAGIPRTPDKSTKDKEEKKEKPGRIGGYDSRSREWS